MEISLLNGAFLGVIYGLIAIGLVVVYRVTRIINFAHGEIGMIGAFVFADLWLDHDLPLVLAVGAGIAVSALLGVITEFVVIRPLRGQPRLTVMVGTLGVSSLLLVYAVRRYSPRPRFARPVIEGNGFEIAGLLVRPVQILTLVVALAILALLALVMFKSSFGLRLRATALDSEAAAEVGVRVGRVSMGTWAIAGAIAGLSAILVSSQVVFSAFFMSRLMLRALAAALLGGLTSVTGAFAGGIFLGMAEGVIGFQWIAPGAVEASLAVLVMAVLIVRPKGLVAAEY